MSEFHRGRRRSRVKEIWWMLITLTATALSFYLSEIWKHGESIGNHVLITSVITWVFLVFLCSLIIFFAINAAKREKEWLESTKKREDAWLQSTKKREDAWLRTFGTPADLFYKTDESSQESYHDKLARFIEQTSKGDKVFIVTHHGTKVDPQRQPTNKEARERYFSILERKVSEQGVKYHRVICFDIGIAKKEEPKYLRQYLIDHCRRVLELEKAYPDRVILKKSVTIFGEDVLLVQKEGKMRIAAITLDVHNPDERSVQTEGALIFHDPPDNKIIQKFASLVDRADKHGRSIKSISDQGEIIC